MATLFPNRGSSLLAAFASLASVFALFFYVSATSAAKPTTTVAYTAAAGSVVKGVVKAAYGRPAQAARVRLVFRRADGDLIRAVTVGVDRRGRYARRMPKGARMVRVTAYERAGSRARTATALYRFMPGAGLSITTVFPRRGSAFLPGVFPY